MCLPLRRQPLDGGPVIPEVDDALATLLRRDALRGSDVDVVFDAPTKDWAARRNAPTIDLYLYDIREDLKRRQRGLLNEYDERGEICARRLPPRHIRLSYLVTAWTQRPQDEHRLLSSLLAALLANETLPRDVLPAALAQIGLPVPIGVALPPVEDRSFADVWSALGGELRPSLDVAVSVPLHAARPIEVGPIAREGLRVAARGVDGEVQDETRGRSRPTAPLVAAADPSGADGKDRPAMRRVRRPRGRQS